MKACNEGEVASGIAKSESSDAPAETLKTETSLDKPCTPRENFLEAFKTKKCQYLLNVLDMRLINSGILPDNRARGTVKDGGPKFVPNPEGEQDVFGITWVYDHDIRGSMVKPGGHILDDIEDWEEVHTIEILLNA